MTNAVWDSKLSHKVDTQFDSYIAEALLMEGKPVGTLDDALARYHVATISDLAEKQKSRLEELPKLAKLFYEIEMPLVKILSKMEQKGILLDTKELSKVGQNI